MPIGVREYLSAAWVAFALLMLAVGAGSGALAGPAVNQFEVKDLSNEVGELEFQSQNAHVFGHPRRKAFEAAPGDFEFDTNSLVKQRHALEMEMTLSHFLRMRVGIEYESERLDDPETPARANDFSQLKFTEVAMEGVLILVPVKKDGIGFGALVEYQAPVAEADEAATLFMGPIVEAKWGAWDFVANLFMVKHLGGGERTPAGVVGRDEKWDFSYATHLQYKYSDAWTFSLEGYGTVDRLGSSGTRSDEAVLFGDHNQHRLGPVVYYTFKADKLRDRPPARSGSRMTPVKAGDDDGPVGKSGDDDEGTSVRIGTGVLFGLNENTPDYSLKWSVEIEF